MDRRTFSSGVACALFTSPFALRAQQPGRVYRLGYLSTPTRQSVERGVEAFLLRLRQLGWIEGQNLAIEYRWADGDVARLPQLAAEMVRLNVDVIVAPAGSAAVAAKNATRSIPIVMIFASDPVGLGLIGSLGRPGGNVTGTTFTSSSEIFGKQLQILKEAVPRISRVALLENSADISFQIAGKPVEEAARALQVRLQRVAATGPEQLEAAFAAMTRERADALLVSGSSTFLAHRAKLAELALRHRVPTMASFREMVEAGLLISYAVNMADFVGRSAVYVDKIFRGAKPGELPVEQPESFELVINQKTAQALGIRIPQLVLQRADQVIG